MKLIAQLKKARLNARITRYCRLPLRANKFLFWSNDLHAYGCNPKYLTEYLLREFPGRYDIVWAFDESVPLPEDLPPEVRTVRYFSYAFLEELHTARFIVCNARISPALYWHKRPGQVYVQTWHSSLRLKKIEGDAADTLSPVYLDLAKRDSEKIDLLISGCRFSTESYRRAFWYNGRILETGTPRCDVLLNDTAARRETVCRRLGLDPEQRIVLYAPTFRKDCAAHDLGLRYDRLREALSRSLGGDWQVLYRFHPNVKIDDTQSEPYPWLTNVTRYNDMQELLCAADVLVTDYSSCMFDAAIAGKPCFLFAPDLDDYLANERRLYFDIRRLPFPLATTMDELDAAVAGFNAGQYREQTAAFLRETGSYEDGNACRRIADALRDC